MRYLKKFNESTINDIQLILDNLMTEIFDEYSIDEIKASDWNGIPNRSIGKFWCLHKGEIIIGNLEDDYINVYNDLHIIRPIIRKRTGIEFDIEYMQQCLVIKVLNKPKNLYNEGIFDLFKKKSKNKIPFSKIEEEIKDYLVELEDDEFIVEYYGAFDFFTIIIGKKGKDEYKDYLSWLDRVDDMSTIDHNRFQYLKEKSSFNLIQIRDTVLRLESFLNEYNLNMEKSHNIESSHMIHEFKIKITIPLDVFNINESITLVDKKIQLIKDLTIELEDMGLEISVWKEGKFIGLIIHDNSDTDPLMDYSHGEVLYNSDVIKDFEETLKSYGMNFRQSSGYVDRVEYKFDKWSKMTNSYFK